MSQESATDLLLKASGASREGSEQLFVLVYDELRRIAERELSRERRDHTLRPTELVHEAFMRLVDQTRTRWQNQAHFKAVACQAMRRILVEHARHRNRLKRGGSWVQVPLEDIVAGTDPDTTILALDRALTKLAEKQPIKARIVEMHFFGGLTHEECARILDISRRTVLRHWTYAQAWLSRELSSA